MIQTIQKKNMGKLIGMYQHSKKARLIETDIRFPKARKLSEGKRFRFFEDWNCCWSNGYPFAEALNRPRGNGYIPRSRHRSRNRYAPYTDCDFPKSITQLGEC